MADDSPTSHPDEDDHELLELMRDVAKLPERVPVAVGDLAVPSTLDVPRDVLERMHASGVTIAPKVGTTLDERYRVDGELGRGGMGIVYAATNLRTGKPVAIKWMALSDHGAHVAALSERFRREARAAARIRHENVVDVYDVGGTDRAPFLVMELLEGESLRARLARGPLSLDEAKSLMLGVFRGVSAAHRAGVIHRDLKPDNIFLSRADESGTITPKVLDFGVAAMRKDAVDGLFTLTRSGAIVGTPAYMAPEQLVAKAVDVRTDVYSLGVVLFECLTGHLPFDARSASELAVKQATEDPARASKFQPELRGVIDRVLERALAREPQDRFADVGAFEAAFMAACDPLAVSEAQSRWGVRRIAWLLSAAFVAVLSVMALRSRSNDTSSLEAPPKREAVVSPKASLNKPLVPETKARLPAALEPTENVTPTVLAVPESPPASSPLPAKAKLDVAPRLDKTVKPPKTKLVEKPVVPDPPPAARPPTTLRLDDF